MVNTARVDFICDHMLLQYPWKFFDAKIPHTLLSWKWYNIFNFRENQGISKLEKGKCFSYINGIKKRWLLLPSLSEAAPDFCREFCRHRRISRSDVAAATQPQRGGRSRSDAAAARRPQRRNRSDAAAAMDFCQEFCRRSDSQIFVAAADFCRWWRFLSTATVSALYRFLDISMEISVDGYSICPLSFSRHFYGDFCRRIQYLSSIVFSTFLWRFLSTDDGSDSCWDFCPEHSVLSICCND